MCVYLYVCVWIYPNTDPEDLWEIIQMKQRTSDTEAQIKIIKKKNTGNLVRVTHFSGENLDKLKNRSHYSKIWLQEIFWRLDGHSHREALKMKKFSVE